MSAPEAYNPLYLALNPDLPPHQIGEDGKKWYRIHSGWNGTSNSLFRVDCPDGENWWVALDDSGWLAYKTKDLNALYLWCELKAKA